MAERKAPPPDIAERRLATAVDRSVIVKAPAGSGKTSLLVARYLKLLERVEEPESILAITFTRKAALEMRERVLEQIDDIESLRPRLAEWDLANRPDRLKIQTIDSFSLQLANAMPMASGVANTRPTDNPQPLYLEAVDRLLLRIVNDDPLASSVADFLATLDNDVAAARHFLVDALARRDQWQMVVADIASAVVGVRESIRRGVSQLRVSAETQFEALLGDPLMRDMTAVLEGIDAHQSHPIWARAAKILLTKDGAPRKRFDKRSGFAPGSSELRDRALQASAHLAELGLSGPLARLAQLPQYTQQHALEPIAIVLSLALVELGEVFRRHGVSDFTELTVRANQALGTDDLPSELALALDYRIDHLLVDEFQDTSIAQFRLLTKLTEGWTPGDGSSFFAVGDPMQSIYRFRDAEVRLYLDTFARGLPNRALEPVELRSNFRTNRPLVDWINTVCGTLFEGAQDALVGSIPFSAARPMVDGEGVANVDMVIGEDVGHVATTVESIRSVDPTGTIAVLVRTRASLAPILAAFRERDIAFRGTDIESLSEAPVVRDLFALSRVLFEPSDRLSALSLLRSPLVGLTSKELAAANEAIIGGASLLTLDLALAPSDRRLARLAEALKAQPRSTSARSRIEETWFELGGSQAYDSTTGAERFFELLDADPLLVDRPGEMADRLDGLMKTVDRSTSTITPVEVMTIHRSKGLEFDHVILPALEATTRETPRPMLLWRAEGDDFLIACKERNRGNGLYEWLANEEREKDRNETKRLIYVALTRARHSVALIGSLEDRDASPPRGSMLEHLWPAISHQARYVEVEAPDRMVPKAQRLSRLPLDYRWKPPSRRPPPERASEPVIADRKLPLLDDWIRREFGTISRQRNVAPVAVRESVWRVWERETLEPQNAVFEALVRHRSATVASADGLRILLAEESEPDSFVQEVDALIIDRWIGGSPVTFDTSEFDADADVNRAIDGRVGEVVQQARSVRAVGQNRLQILFTAIGRLVEVAF